RNMGTEYVLLVGGDTYDYRDFLNIGSLSFIPSLYAQTDANVQFAPVDPLYADTDGDQVPDLAIGRFPVRTSQELATLVNKTLAYATKSYAHTAVFAADKYDAAQRYSFTQDSETLINAMPADWQVSRAHMDELGLAGARTALMDAVNNGVAVTSFFGHGALNEWSFDRLFTGADAQTLTNSGQPTVVTQWGCWNTYYVSPTEDTMGHALLLNGDRGAAAVLGAATLTRADYERQLGEALYARLFVPGTTVGQAVLAAKRAFAQTRPGGLDVILGWTQLGDPALVIQP
ncbi:MAG: C25 family cysteine peptidase, partial [Gammaproteobacteria bacterium]|nr:C25 family cysteine peptidase [Gammaproteobacteria bacterium]